MRRCQFCGGKGQIKSEYSVQMCGACAGTGLVDDPPTTPPPQPGDLAMRIAYRLYHAGFKVKHHDQMSSGPEIASEIRPLIEAEFSAQAESIRRKDEALMRMSEDHDSLADAISDHNGPEENWAHHRRLAALARAAIRGE